MRPYVYVLSFGMALAASSLTRGNVLFSWDSVNFALGVEHIDVTAHRPHPPGYIALIAAARFLQFGSDVPTALLRVTALAAALNAVVLWEFVLGATKSQRAAWVAWSVVISSPLCWFYASTAEVYGLELLSSLLCGAAAVACLRHRSSTWPALGLGVSFGMSILVKPTVSVLMMPLWVYVCGQLSGSARQRVVLSGLGGMAIGAAALAAVIPVHQLVSLTLDQLGGTLAGDARFDPFHRVEPSAEGCSRTLCALLWAWEEVSHAPGDAATTAMS